MKVLEGRLITVSNRLPVEVKTRGGSPRLSRSAGGLATALDSIWRYSHGVWIGWGGAADSPAANGVLQKATRGHSYSFKPVPLSRDEISKFYSGFANEIIWPLFHDMPSRCNFDPEYWEVYQRVNRRFAQAAAEAANGKDLVWVHDYHLMLMGRYLREASSSGRAGFFLHIPFPAPDIFEKLPWRKQILRALLHYDLLGFQTDRDRYNFVSCLERIVPEAISTRDDPFNTIELENRRTRVGTFPISIGFEEFANHAAGFRDMSIGVKTLLFDCELLLISMQMTTTIPTGVAFKGLGAGHMSLEPSLLASIKLMPDTYLQTQVAYWIPIGGDQDFEGATWRYGVSLNHQWFHRGPFALISTAEFNGWTFTDGAIARRELAAAGVPINGMTRSFFTEKGSGESYFTLGGEKIGARMRRQHRQIAARADQKIHPARQRTLGRAYCKPGCAARGHSISIIA